MWERDTHLPYPQGLGSPELLRPSPYRLVAYSLQQHKMKAFHQKMHNEHTKLSQG